MILRIRAFWDSELTVVADHEAATSAAKQNEAIRGFSFIERREPRDGFTCATPGGKLVTPVSSRLGEG
jgi:hypothetical protein